MNRLTEATSQKAQSCVARGVTLSREERQGEGLWEHRLFVRIRVVARTWTITRAHTHVYDHVVGGSLHTRVLDREDHECLAAGSSEGDKI